jgi:hypothetical protein
VRRNFSKTKTRIKERVLGIITKRRGQGRCQAPKELLGAPGGIRFIILDMILEDIYHLSKVHLRLYSYYEKN